MRLLARLELEQVDAESVRRRWRRAGRDPARWLSSASPRAGSSASMSATGTRGLIGGTTGSGKSELLPSFVAGLATHTAPPHLTFILMDYKGGAAFDECSRLPPTVGMVTDLDQGLGERAHEALDAEIRYRERLLRSAGADILPPWRCAAPPALGRLPS